MRTIQAAHPVAGAGAKPRSGGTFEPVVSEKTEQAPYARIPGRALLPLAPRGGDEAPQLPEIRMRHRLANAVECFAVAGEKRVAQPLDTTVACRLAPAGAAHRVQGLRDRLGVAFPEYAPDVADLPAQSGAFEPSRIGHRGFEIRPHGDSSETARGQGRQRLAERLERKRLAFAL